MTAKRKPSKKRRDLKRPVIDLRALAAAAKKATRGPWHWEMVDPSVMALYGPRDDYDFVLWSQICKACVERGNRCTAPSEDNAHFIAMCDPGTILELIRRARRRKDAR